MAAGPDGVARRRHGARRKETTMGQTVRWLGVATLVASMLGLTQPATVAGADRGARPAPSVVSQTQHVTITTPSVGLHEMPLVVGIRQGFYTAENLDVTR